ncbi:MAG: cytochrome c [Candidatus Sumerlaeia bacterium]
MVLFQSSAKRLRGRCWLILLVLLAAGCRNDLADQPSFRPFQQTDFFPDRTSARMPVEGALARGELVTDEAFTTGKAGGRPVQRMPMTPTRDMLERGRARFGIYCAPCHGLTGEGNGMIVQRGFGPPPPYHIGRLRAAPVGHLFDVIANGYGTMYGYASRVPTADRWAIVAYIRALQLSRHARLEDLPPGERDALAKGKLP